MKPNRPILTQHRFQRIVLWTLAMLHWIAAVFRSDAVTPRHRRQRGDVSIHGLTRMVVALMMIRALALIGRTRQVPRGGTDATYTAPISAFRCSAQNCAAPLTTDICPPVSRSS